MPALSDQQHRSLAFWGMALMVIGLPLSLMLVSIGQFVLAGNWLLEGNYKKRLVQFFTDPLSLVIISIYLLFLLGMIHTQNVEQGLNELRIKLPILIVPLMLFTTKLPSRKRIQDLFMLFVVACVAGSIIGFLKYMGITGEEVVNKRHLSIFTSHIRFGLMIVFSFFILAYHWVINRKEWSITEKVLTLVVMAWLFYFLILLESLSSYLAFILLLGFSLWRMIFTTKKVWLRVSVLLSIVIGSLSAAVYVNGIYQNHMLDFPFDSSTLDVYTANGRKYIHQKDVKLRENGHRVWNNVCLKELKNEWPKRSSVGIFEENKNGYKIRFTLTHYLTSKGLKKDSIGVHALSDEDIKHIENGHTNYKFVTDWGVSRRIDDLFTEIENYHTGGNPNNSSLIQRLTYFKVGLKLFKENVVFGIGSGDVRNAFDSYYAQNDHGLVDKRKGIAHNQYMNIAIGMGVIGLVWFILAFFYPLRFYWKDYLFTCFIIMIAISFLSDNTLDSQAGATLFAFFNSFLMIRKEMETADALI